MAVSGVSKITKDYTEERTIANKSQALGKDAFMQLLVAQMKYQDPLEPMDNSQSIAQMAQFSSLEKQDNLNKSFESFVASQKVSNMLSGSNMVGKTVTGKINVTGTDSEGKETTTTEQVEGWVTSVSYNDNGTPILKLMTSEGKEHNIEMGNITKITNPESQKVGNIVAGTAMLGQTIEGYVTVSEPRTTNVDGVTKTTYESVDTKISGIVSKVSVENGKTILKIKDSTGATYDMDIDRVTNVG